MKREEPEYRPLESEEREENPVTGSIKRSSSILQAIIWVQVGNFLAFVLFYLWSTSQHRYYWGYGVSLAQRASGAC
jgi:hypothetical protein